MFSDDDRIRPWRDNRYYWEYNGKPTLLLGGSDEDNLFNHPELMMRNLEALAECGGNYIRCTLSCRDPGNLWPFAMVDGRYDLDRFDARFWGRLRSCLREARKRDIIVQVELWDPHDFWDRGDAKIWSRNPWNPAMNVNYTAENTRLKERWDIHPSTQPTPFFLSPVLKDDVLLSYQEKFVVKVLEETLDFPNVLYCIDNEVRAPPEWTLYWARLVHGVAREHGVEVQLTEMWDPWDLRHELHSVTYAHPELFTFTEVSQNNWNSGRTHYERLIWFRSILTKYGGPRPMNNVKIYGAPEPGSPAIPELNVDRFWKCIFAGCASVRFHRPPTGIGLTETSRRMIKAARTFTSSFNLFNCEPRPDLIEDAEREAYCLAEPGETYALYLSKGSRVKLRAGISKVKTMWFNVEKCRFTGTETLVSEDYVFRIKPPSRGLWLALLSTS
ncbi:hypothetical protein DRO57_03645 [Candidatus Bathyarchaeota archaeon]|nr:MAG: hypothetical protein DRO57_03645 [Candidatus Bathyarchaeota archaeon]